MENESQNQLLIRMAMMVELSIPVYRLGHGSVELLCFPHIPFIRTGDLGADLQHRHKPIFVQLPNTVIVVK